MTDASQNNEFINRAIRELGPELLQQGTFEQQLIALESLVTGLFMAVLAADPLPRVADAYLSALTQGIRQLLRDPKLQATAASFGAAAASWRNNNG